jgi:hypothetical protein
LPRGSRGMADTTTAKAWCARRSSSSLVWLHLERGLSATGATQDRACKVRSRRHQFRLNCRYSGVQVPEAEDLQKAVERMHRCKARLLATEPVTAFFGAEVLWSWLVHPLSPRGSHQGRSGFRLVGAGPRSRGVFRRAARYRDQVGAGRG